MERWEKIVSIGIVVTVITSALNILEYIDAGTSVMGIIVAFTFIQYGMLSSIGTGLRAKKQTS